MNDGAAAQIKGAAAVLGSAAGALIGQLDGMLYALLVFLAIDYISGVLVAVKQKTLSSAAGFSGLAKKVLVLLLVIIANTLDVHVLGSGAMARGMVIAFYLTNEGLSILENAGKLGVPFPARLHAVLAQLSQEPAGEDDKL